MDVKRKLWVKVIAVFLSMLMVFQILPLTVFANEIANIEALAPTLEETEPANIEYELEDERDEFSKTYLLEDGTYATYVSSTAIHEKSDDGEWQEITEITVPETMEELQSEMSNTATVLSDSSVDESQSITTTQDKMTFQSIGNGLTGVRGSELRIQDYDNDTSQICSVGYAKINNFNLPDLGDACIVTKATLGANCSYLSDYTNSIVMAQTVEGNWPQANSQEHPLSDSIMDYNVISSSKSTYYEWDITEAACRWSNGTLDNYGIALSPYNNNNACKVRAYVSNIVMYYSVVNELDENYTFHSVDMGRAGTAYVNDFTNDFYLVRNELSIDGNVMPVSITRTFNNSHKNNSNIAGLGWHFNNDSYLSVIGDLLNWVKDDGSITCFEYKDDTWQEQGVENGYTVTEDDDYYIISSEDDVYKYYYGQSTCQLEQIVDKNNKSIVFSYDEDSYLLSSVTDGIGRKYNFNLGTYGDYLFVNKISVKDSAGNTIKLDSKELSLSYGYTNFANEKRLGSVTYTDTKTVNYEYDANGNMTVIRNIDGTSLHISYNSNGKVTSYTKFASDGETILDRLTIDSREAYQRIFTDKNNKITRQQYDSQLNQVSEITDEDGYFKKYDKENGLQSISVTEEHTNLLTNYDFSDGLTGWNRPSNRGVEVVTDNDNGFKLSKYDNNVLKIPGKYNAINYAKQTYLFNDDKDHTNEVYTAGVWAKINGSIPRTDALNNGKTRTVGVILNGYVNDESGETTEFLADITFDNSITDWQYMMVTFRLGKNYDGIEFVLSYNYQIGDAYFDGATLYNSTVSSTIDPGPPAPDPTCLCKNCSELNCPCTCESEETCTHIWCKRGTTTVENEYGLTTKEITTDAVTSMESSYSYNNDTYYLMKSTDENGTVTHYTYDPATGKLISMATGNQNDKIDYTYNAVGLLKTVSQTVTNIVTGEKVKMISEYTYNGDTLTQINHSGTIYSFEYDGLGNVSNVKVASQSLAQYSYINPDQLGYILYGNGDRINYTYDDNGNITSISTQSRDDETDSIIEYEYTYNDNGKLSSYTDNVNGTVTTYTDNGYTIVIPSADENTEDIIIYSTATTDDTNESSINLFGYEFNTKKYADTYDIETAQTTASSRYTLPCETLGITGIGDSITVTDYYGRDISSTFKLHTNDFLVDDDGEDLNRYDYIVNNSYTYVTDENNVTTNLVKSYTSEIKLQYNLNDEEQAEIDEAIENGEISQEELDELYAELNNTILSLTTSYEYDNAGRITKISRDNTPFALYKYDEAGQLTEEINFELESVCRYTYDEGGNITSKVYYDDADYDEENNEVIYGEPTDTINYSYESDTPWGDLLTNYNGVDIDYDKIGNPLNYQGIAYNKETVDVKLEWDGRLLKTVTYPDGNDGKPTQKYEYSYNADGLRTKKDRYVWNDNISDYQLYQTVEYVWDGNVVKGYRITYRTSTNNPDSASNYIVLPLYDEKQEIIGVATKVIGENTDNETPDEEAENVYYFIKDAQGNTISMFDPMNNDYSVVYSYTGYGQTTLSIPGEEERIDKMPDGTFWEQLAKGFAAIGLAALYSIYKEINPFMYRGYMYDGETGLYYNQSRYYSGEWGRFINADDPMLVDTGTGTPNANNVFAYCENNPINNIDPTGLKAVNRNYGIWVYYYQHKTAKSKAKNPFGHLDIAFGGKSYSYGDYSSGNKKANFFIATTTSYQNYINNYSTFKVQDKTRLMFTQSEYNSLRNYYNSFNKTWMYRSNNFSGDYYKITSGKYKDYKLASRNCSTMVLNALEYAIPYMTRNTVSKYVNYLGTLNTPYYVNLLVNYIRNDYKL